MVSQRSAVQPAVVKVGATGVRDGRSSDIDEAVRRSRLLVVDDQPIIREMIHAFLVGEGFFDVHFAVDGIDALEKVEAVNPDIVILDLYMPNMDGREVCRRLRESPKTENIPILIQTASDDPDERAEMFVVGATDLVNKPLNRVELVSRLKIHLENRHLIRQLDAFRARMEAELAVARRMQHALMPNMDTVELVGGRYGLRVTAYFETCEELGGDFWSVAPHSNHEMMFSIVDFSGHGVVAALNTFRFQSMAIQTAGLEKDIALVTKDLNEALSRVLPANQFATAIEGVVDIRNDCIRYAGCGAPSPLLALPGRERPYYCESQGLPLGISVEARHDVHEVPFPPGSTIFLYSDAVLESPSIQSPAITEDDLIAIVDGALKAGLNPVEAVKEKLFAAAARPLPDDLTLLCIQRPE